MNNENKIPAKKPFTNGWIIYGIFLCLAGILLLLSKEVSAVTGIFILLSGTILIFCVGIPRLETAKKIYEKHKDDEVAYKQAMRQEAIEREEREKQAIEKVKQERKNKGNYNSNNKLVCPKCGCTDFTPLRRKFSLLAGFATNKVDMVCNKCGTIIK